MTNFRGNEANFVKKKVRRTSKKFLSILLTLLLTVALLPAVVAHGETTVSFDVLRTAINPGYYFSGILIDMGIPLKAGDVDKDTFAAAAKVTEANGDVQGSFGNFAWDPEKEDYALEDNWAKWNILDAYVADAQGNKAEEGNYVKLDIEWGTRTEQNGESDASRYDVPATRASWYTLNGFHAFATVEVKLTQNKGIPGIADAVYVQDETRHDPLFSAFDLSLEVPGGGKAPLYTPANASEDNLRPLLVWFHGTGERYAESKIDGKVVNNAGANLVGNRALAFADEEFQEQLGGAYVLAPQSTTEGWSSKRLDDMEALIHQVIEDNYIDPERVYVGGLSMGTGMTTPLITSTTDNRIQFAAAMLVSGGNLNEAQAKVIADKGFPVYLVGSASDGAAGGLPGTYERLIAAGVDAKLELYPEGPVFDGTDYFGAHDAWNYVYNNLVEDDQGQTIFQWLSQQTSEPAPPFNDVAAGAWYYGAVKYVYDHEIMAGTGDTTFGPEENLDRATVVQILYNLEGTPDISEEDLGYPYEDVDADIWYTNAVYWARLTGVAEGDGDGTFRPEDDVTRQELAQMLYNYAEYKEYDLTAEGDLSQYPDSEKIAGWAEKAMSWANGNKLINGHDDGTIDPEGTAVRAQAASILTNFHQTFVAA